MEERQLTPLRFGIMVDDLSMEAWKVETVRKNFDRTEISLFRRVLNEGNEDGVFDVMNVKLTAEIMHYCLKGCEVPYIFGRYTARGPEELYLYVRTMVTRQLQNKHTSLTINDN